MKKIHFQQVNISKKIKNKKVKKFLNKNGGNWKKNEEPNVRLFVVFKHHYLTFDFLSFLSFFFFLSDGKLRAAFAAASLAIGTLNGEQET